ncbi:MAG: transposase [Candidatus Thiodiazotropha sp. (ex Lucinoma aequizonata)]|nr:transposase [Candidatus Thiodiazotropha sp. (ex Lucinoma aequizonata)]MCU7911406.1 transposase [Candidatus Thiodiazotropha sp. (ex Lucinoma aequizonata)]
MSGVKAISVDEIAWQRGHWHLPLVYQIVEHNKRLLWIGEKRMVKTLLRFFRWFGKERSLELKFVCSDIKRVFDLVKDFGTSQSTKIDSIFDSLLCPDRPAYVTIPYCTSRASCSCTTPS